MWANYAGLGLVPRRDQGPGRVEGPGVERVFPSLDCEEKVLTQSGRPVLDEHVAIPHVGGTTIGHERPLVVVPQVRVVEWQRVPANGVGGVDVQARRAFVEGERMRSQLLIGRIATHRERGNDHRPVVRWTEPGGTVGVGAPPDRRDRGKHPLACCHLVRNPEPHVGVPDTVGDIAGAVQSNVNGRVTVERTRLERLRHPVEGRGDGEERVDPVTSLHVAPLDEDGLAVEVVDHRGLVGIVDGHRTLRGHLRHAREVIDPEPTPLAHRDERGSLDDQPRGRKCGRGSQCQLIADDDLIPALLDGRGSTASVGEGLGQGGLSTDPEGADLDLLVVETSDDLAVRIDSGSPRHDLVEDEGPVDRGGVVGVNQVGTQLRTGPDVDLSRRRERDALEQVRRGDGVAPTTATASSGSDDDLHDVGDPLGDRLAVLRHGERDRNLARRNGQDQPRVVQHLNDVGVGAIDGVSRNLLRLARSLEDRHDLQLLLGTLDELEGTRGHPDTDELEVRSVGVVGGWSVRRSTTARVGTSGASELVTLGATTRVAGLEDHRRNDDEDDQKQGAQSTHSTPPRCLKRCLI